MENTKKELERLKQQLNSLKRKKTDSRINFDLQIKTIEKRILETEKTLNKKKALN